MSDLLSKSVLRGDRKIYRYLYIVNRREADPPPRVLFLLFLQGNTGLTIAPPEPAMQSRVQPERLMDSTTAKKDRIVVPSFATVPRSPF
jgi:hypothetical protein